MLLPEEKIRIKNFHNFGDTRRKINEIFFFRLNVHIPCKNVSYHCKSPFVAKNETSQPVLV